VSVGRREEKTGRRKRGGKQEKEVT